MSTKRLMIVVSALALLSGCVTITTGNVKEHDQDTTTPKMFVKSGLNQEQMINDSVNCQDRATAEASTNNNYISSVGFTPKQVEVYESCMIGKGYKEVE